MFGIPGQVMCNVAQPAVAVRDVKRLRQLLFTTCLAVVREKNASIRWLNQVRSPDRHLIAH